MSTGWGHPFQSIYLGIPVNMTIAASMAGTVAATQISASISVSYARSMQIFNLTGRNLELIIGADPGTANMTGTPSVVSGSVLFCPGTISSVPGNGRGAGQEVAISGGMQLYVRTTENTPVTCSSTTPLIISFWA